MAPDTYCEQLTDRKGSTFYYSVLFLDPARKSAATALQALCVELKQAVVRTTDENAARIKLAWWRNEIALIRTQTPQHPVTRALMPLVREYPHLAPALEALVDAAEMDLMQTRYLDFKALEQYCALAGGAASECAAIILGGTDENVRRAMRSAGLALCLIGLIRNVGEHSRNGRVYLPVNELQQFNVPVADVLNARYSDNFRALMEFQYVRALALLNGALIELPRTQRKPQRALLISAAIHRALLEEIRADGFRVLHERASLTPIRKFWLAWKTWVMA